MLNAWLLYRGLRKEKVLEHAAGWGRLLVQILLANIAIRFPGETLKWDADALEFTNKEEANQWVSRDYREGWDLEKLITA